MGGTDIRAYASATDVATQGTCGPVCPAGLKKGSQQAASLVGSSLFDTGFRLLSQLFVLLCNGKKARFYVANGLTLGRSRQRFACQQKYSKPSRRTPHV